MKKLNSYNFIIISFLVSFLILLNSCSSRGKIWDPADAREFPAEPEARVQKNLEEGRGFRIMDLNRKEGGGSFEFATSNAMWRATLDTLDFMPLATANYSGGIIITDWYTDSKSRNQAIKITIRFLTNEIRVDALDIKVFKKNCMADQITNCTIITENGTLVAELKKNILKKAATYEKIKKEKNFKPYEVGKPDNPRGRNKKKD